MKSRPITRRTFFYGSLLAGAVPLGGFGSQTSLKSLGYKSPNEKLNIASIGAGGKARSDIAGCAATENIVALCDVDEVSAKRTFEQFPNAPKFTDYREMLDKQGSSIDAVIVTIPDHMHAAAAISAMQLGKHVYVQKPLAHTVWECRELLKAAERYNVATQMGNQGYSNEGTRQCAEMVWAGADRQRHRGACVDESPCLAAGRTAMPALESPVPDSLNWDLVARCSKRPTIQRRLSAVHLAGILRLRLGRARRHGVPYPGRAEYGAPARRAHVS